MVIVGVLVALLIPAITGAMRTANNATVTGEFQTLSTSLANFRTQFGDYPPSRVLLSETGAYDIDPTGPAGAMIVSANGTGGTDITYAALAQRTLAMMRKFWPRVPFTTVTGATAAPLNTTTNFYDFNGDGVRQTTPYILEGDECLVFFLGGIPLNTGTAAAPVWSMSGWGKVPANPFSNAKDLDDPSTAANENLTLNPMFFGTRNPPLHEFANDRLRDPDANAATDPVRFPAYFDRLGTDMPIVYFSARGNESYDPNDCNMAEMDDAGAGPLLRQFRVAWTVQDSGGAMGRAANSAPPNPYTSSAATAPTVQWMKGSSFQLLSAGRDGQWGPGGQYDARPAVATTLPANPAAEVKPTGVDRSREFDNLSSFATGPLR